MLPFPLLEGAGAAAGAFPVVGGTLAFPEELL
jgi:hypothetical protein